MKPYFRRLGLAFLLCSFLPHSSEAAGNDNPTGVTGEYNGSITTAGHYDPYSGNAKRFVTDCTVTGAVGAYPLKWTRVLNTRGRGGAFGHGGTWRHSYQWGMWVRPYRDYQYYPNQYEGPDGEIDYPDGRKLTLRWDPGDHTSLYVEGSGSQELDRIEDQGGGNYDLLLNDGGRVKFYRIGATTATSYSLEAREIVDPHGITTRLERDSLGRLSKITEPAGRYLQINWTRYSYQVTVSNQTYTNNVDVISSVQAFAWEGQLTETVNYVYGDPEIVGQVRYYYLRSVNYADGTSAIYSYYPSSSGDAQSAIPGRIESCNDVRYAGAMSKIEYHYENPTLDGEVAVGQITGEKFPGASSFISQVLYPVGPFNTPEAYRRKFTRTEKRADGRERNFQYSSDGNAELESYTDFHDANSEGHTSHIDYQFLSATSYRKIFRDARGKETWTDKESNIGAVKKLTHPGGATVEFEYSDAYLPYYLTERRDENGHSTYFDRDGNNRVWRTRYPDDGQEQFTYNPFGQIETHTMTSGGVEHFEYYPDNRGLKWKYWPPATCDTIVCSDPNPGSHPTVYTYYDGTEDGGLRPDRIDRLKSVTDPLGHTTTYDYNKRGQVTKVTNPVTPPATQPSFTESLYNPDGTLKWTKDELGHKTEYKYDEYKRVTEVWNPLDKVTRNDYNPTLNPADDRSLSHTTSSVYLTTSHMGKEIKYDYDENFRRKTVTQAPGIAGEEATTTSTYDPVGNLEFVTDPNGQFTGKQIRYEYDDRNRKKSVTDPLGQKTEWEYDDAGNVENETRADGYSVEFLEYDPMNRLKEKKDERGYHSYLEYYPGGNLKLRKDERGKVYSYEYDALNRQKRATYPPPDETSASRTELWKYDIAGNLETFTNRNGAVQTFQYDERNRPWRFDWSDGTSWQQTVYDEASRVTQINNDASEIHQTYYADNRLETEGTRTTAFGETPLRTVTYTYTDDGNRFTVQYPGTDLFIYEYTGRNQLKALWAAGQGQPVVSYGYDLSGNMRTITRENGTSTAVTPDDVNRVTSITHNFTGPPSPFSRNFEYAYNEVNNVTAVRRDWGAGDGFEYDESRQIKGFKRDGTFASWPPETVNDPANTMGIVFDPCGNRLSVTNSNPGLADITYAVNDLNQYRTVTETGGPSPTPTATPTATPAPTPTATPTATPPGPTPTATPTATATATPTATATATPTATATATPTATATATPTATATATPTATATATPTATATATPTATATATPTATATATPTATPPQQVAEPTCNPDDGQIYFTTGSKTINVATSTSGANMRYTFGSTLPTSSSGTLIAASSGTVSVTPTAEGRTLNIIAFKGGMSDSWVHSATYYYESGNFADPGSTSSSESGGESELAGAENGQPSYDHNGNLTYYKGLVYTYDAQNRLRLVWNESVLVAEYYYDGKNRQIARRLDNEVRFSVWDGWELIEEWGSERATAYLQGATGVIKSWTHNNTLYYYQDKLGSTTHVANASGALLESYRYDLYGAPSYFDSTSQPLNSSTYNVVDLYAGERWIGVLSMYDLRNRFMSPELGRFLQADPIGFKGDASNLYRYCHNDPENFTDPMGLESAPAPIARLNLTATGKGDWDFFNGRVALAQINLQQQQPAGNQSSAVAPKDEGNKGMRFVPTKVADDKKTALPVTRDHSGSDYHYQLKSGNRRVSGVGVIVQEKLEHVSGVKVSDYQKKPAPLQSNGIFPDRVGLGWRPSSRDNGLSSVVHQTWEMTINGRPVNVSTKLGHDVSVKNSEVITRVWIITP